MKRRNPRAGPLLPLPPVPSSPPGARQRCVSATATSAEVQTQVRRHRYAYTYRGVHVQVRMFEHSTHCTTGCSRYSRRVSHYCTKGTQPRRTFHILVADFAQHSAAGEC
jgi:hypothetical protein